MNDSELKKNIQQLQRKLSKLAAKYEYNDYKFWDYLDFHKQEPQESENCAWVLTCDSGMPDAFEGYSGDTFTSAFESISEKSGFIYETHGRGIFHFYIIDEKINERTVS